MIKMPVIKLNEAGIKSGAQSGKAVGLQFLELGLGEDRAKKVRTIVHVRCNWVMFSE